MLKYVFIDVDVQARYAVQPFDVRDAPALQDTTCYISSLPLGAHRRRDDLHGPFSDGFRLRIAMRRVHVFWPRVPEMVAGNDSTTLRTHAAASVALRQALSIDVGRLALQAPPWLTSHLYRFYFYRDAMPPTHLPPSLHSSTTNAADHHSAQRSTADQLLSLLLLTRSPTARTIACAKDRLSPALPRSFKDHLGP